MKVGVCIAAVAGAVMGSAEVTAQQPTGQPSSSEAWAMIEPGGLTDCAFDTPFRFFFHQGSDPDVLLVYFQGGGACWNWVSCSGMFDTSVSETELQDFRGIFDFSNAQNPFRNASVLFVPYCTGDVHVGDATVAYGEPAWNSPPVRHNGWNNVSAVRAWAERNIKTPRTLVVAGASAGSYGAVFHSPSFARLYPSATLVVIGDSGVPLLHDYGPILDAWGAGPRLRSEWASGGYGAASPVTLEKAHERIAELRPDAMITHITAADDAVQKAFFIFSGSPDARRVSFELLDMLHKRIARFRAFVVAGSDHGLMRTDQFYTYQSGGTRLVEWIRDLITGKGVASQFCASC